MIVRLGTILGTLLVVFSAMPVRAGDKSIRQIIVTKDLKLRPGAELAARLVIRADHVTVDGAGATLVGPGRIGDPASLAKAGIGVLAEGCSGVTLRRLTVRGFCTGLVIRDGRNWRVEQCDFSDNYHNPKHGWGELPPRGGIVLQRVQHAVLHHNRANRVWNGLHLIESNDNLIQYNDFSHCSNTCAKLWRASRNRLLHNNLSYGIRIDRAAGEVHARDSACVLIETGSDDNYWYDNDMTHGGDGLFIRVLNGWVSRGNVFVENDTSWANNNCVESWSPGNVYIRNRANHGSYGFWLGGSDQTVLVGNEAAYNGLPDGFHNAPQPGFGHGGIVIVGGSSSHTRIVGNWCHHNNGGGIVFRGHAASKGKRWRTEHWIVQQNRLEHNRWGIWGRWGRWMWLAKNECTNNTEGNYLEEVTFLHQASPDSDVDRAPRANLVGPTRVAVGRTARFDASGSRDPAGRPLHFVWRDGQFQAEGPVLERVFNRPGFHRLGLTVDNGVLADMAWRDLLVVAPVARELGTEGESGRWGYELEGNAGRHGRVWFADDPDAVVGRRALRFRPDPYPGLYATAVYPADRRGDWDFSQARLVRFWIKVRNPNLPGFQNAGPVLRLYTAGGTLRLQPTGRGNLFTQLPYSEARWAWFYVQVPLAGDAQWERQVQGRLDLSRTRAISLSLDSWGGDPFTVWLDGLSVE